MKIAIIGAGLAGTSLAFVLNQYVSDITIYDQNKVIAGDASSNPCGLINPRFSAFRTPESDFYTSAFALAVRTFDEIAANTASNMRTPKNLGQEIGLGQQSEQQSGPQSGLQSGHQPELRFMQGSEPRLGLGVGQPLGSSSDQLSAQNSEQPPVRIERKTLGHGAAQMLEQGAGQTIGTAVSEQVSSQRSGGEESEASNAIGWKKCGALHLIVDEKKQKRFAQTLENWHWPPEHMRKLCAKAASDIAGVELAHDALYLPESGYVRPKALCEYYAKGVQVKLGVKIENLEDIDADIIILANGMGVKHFAQSSWIPVTGVRGQITQMRCAALQSLRTNLCYGGYCSPAIGGAHVVGATFQRWLSDTTLRPEDDAENIERLRQLLPGDLGVCDVVGQRASMRAASKDHFPVIGRIDTLGQDMQARKRQKIYVSCGHGSHGILNALAGAHLLADTILQRPSSQTRFTKYALAPNRFVSL